MSDCCKCSCSKSVAALNCCERKEFWDWFIKTERTYTAAEVTDLLEKVKEFNAGAIDEYLTNHVDKSFDAWRKALDGIEEEEPVKPTEYDGSKELKE